VRWGPAIGLEIAGEPPDQVAHVLLRPAQESGEGADPVHEALRMHPAQGMAADLELPGIIADHSRVGQQAMGSDRAFEPSIVMGARRRSAPEPGGLNRSAPSLRGQTMFRRSRRVYVWSHERRDDGFGASYKSGAWSPRTDALPTYARTFKQQGQSICKKIRLSGTCIPTKPGKPIAVGRLELFDHASRGMISLRQFEGGIREITTTPVRTNVLCRQSDPRMKLRQRIVRASSFQLGPLCLGTPCRVPQALDNQVILRAKMTIERHLVGSGGFSDRIDADPSDAVFSEQAASRIDDPIARANLWRTHFPRQAVSRHRKFPPALLTSLLLVCNYHIVTYR
jgi:hypothetical protein